MVLIGILVSSLSAARTQTRALADLEAVLGDATQRRQRRRAAGAAGAAGANPSPEAAHEA